MEISVAIDANVVVALVDDQDKWHTAAVELRNVLVQAGAELIYFDCVINEAISVVGCRTEERKQSEQFGHLLDVLISAMPIGEITWIAQEAEELFPRVLELCRQTKGTLNYHDALMSLICQEWDIPNIVSFDQDFDNVSWLKRIGSAEQAKSLFESLSEESGNSSEGLLPADGA